MSKQEKTIPNIDLGGKVKVIAEEGGKIFWKTVGHCFATRENALRIMRQHKLTTAWLFDDLGNKELITG